MNRSAISGDLLVELAIGAVVIGAVVYLVRKGGDAAAAAVDAVVTGANPANPNNVVNSGVRAVGGAIVTDPAGPGKNADGSWSLGGWVYDVMH